MVGLGATLTQDPGTDPSSPYYTQLPAGGPINCPLTTGDANYLGIIGNGAPPSYPGGTYGYAFAKLGVTDVQVAKCVAPNMTPGFNPHWDSYWSWKTTGVASAPQTNYSAPVPNATTASAIGGQVVPAGSMPGEAQPAAAAASPLASFFGGSSASASPTSACSFALFGDTSCIGPFGTTTALALAALVAAFFVFGSKH
jgi:hypothetical protein